MRATRFGAALAIGVGACSGSQAVTMPGDACSAYTSDLDVRGYCITQHIDEVSDPKAMLELCASTGAYEGDCRTRWVERWSIPNSGATDHDVVSACLDDDCRFIALDRRPVADIFAQMDRCKGAGHFAEDCVRHAMQRWVVTKPDEAMVARMAAGAGPYPAVAATYAGQAVGCWHIGECGMAWRTDCEAGVALAGRDTIACTNPMWRGVLPPR